MVDVDAPSAVIEAGETVIVEAKAEAIPLVIVKVLLSAVKPPKIGGGRKLIVPDQIKRQIPRGDRDWGQHWCADGWDSF